MKITTTIRRLFWRSVLCEPEERAELQSGYRFFDDYTLEQFERRKARYEFTFGPLPTAADETAETF